MLRTIDVTRLAADVIAGSRAVGADVPHPILRRELIAQAKYGEGLLARAEQRADAMLEQASQQAQEEREAGFRAGVQAGVDAALEPMVKLVAQLDALKQALHDDAANTLRASMQSLMRQAPVLEALVDAVLEAHRPGSASIVWVRVPSQADIQALVARGAAAGLTLRVTRSTRENDFSISWDGHVWEADLDELCGPCRVGSAGLASTLTSAGAHEACRRALLEKCNALMA